MACSPCEAVECDCDEDGNVIGINLQGFGLAGHIPAALKELSHLRRLKLGFNRLTGPIPPELGQLVGLELLVCADPY